MKHELERRVRFPWLDVLACSRCQLFISVTEAGIFFMRPPPKKDERGGYRWFQLAPAAGSLAYYRPFVALEPLREAVYDCFPAAA